MSLNRVESSQNADYQSYCLPSEARSTSEYQLDRGGAIAEHPLVEPSATLSTESLQLLALHGAIAHTLSRASDLKTVLAESLTAIEQHLSGIAAVRLWTFNPEANLLELQAIAGTVDLMDAFPDRIPAGISIVGFIAQNHAAYSTNTIGRDAAIGAQAQLQQAQITAFAGYPLLLEETLIGVLAVFSHEALSPLVQTTLGTIATQLAIAIDRVWARDELIVGREALLFRLANQIRKSLDLNIILANAVQEIRNLLQIDSCHVLWYVPQFDQPLLSITHEAQAPGLASLVGEYPASQVTALYEQVIALQPIRTHNVTVDVTLSPELQTVLTGLGITAQLMLPMEMRSGQIGAIMCSQHGGARVWTDSEVELLQAVVDQLALAIDQAELYSQSRSAAIAAQAQARQLSEALQNLKHAQSQLIQSEKMSSLGQMVAGIAHEINNPVNFITGNLSHASTYVQDLLRLLELYRAHTLAVADEIREWEDTIDIDFLTEDLPNLFSSMKIGADRIRQIVLSLRNFSRLDEAEMKPVHIHDGIDNTLMILQSRLRATPGQSAIHVTTDYADLPKVTCYAGELNQVFMNVLGNAIDALEGMREEGAVCNAIACSLPQIQIQTELQEDWVLIRIRDNGPGMTEAIKFHSFDPFFTTKPIGKGTGLGLSISYQIVVERHKGKFECVSAPGEGAEFQIYIPLQPPASFLNGDRPTH